ncbi:MAG: hypothetical protein ACXAAH_17050 [Promethearchaeota archaeon]
MTTQLKREEEIRYTCEVAILNIPLTVSWSGKVGAVVISTRPDNQFDCLRRM